MSQSNNRFACSSCGRTFPWKPEMAGRQAKCKCGHVLTVPADLPVVEEEAIALEEAAAAAEVAQPVCPSCGQGMEPGAVLCVACGYNIRTGGRMATRVGGDEGAVAAPAKAAAATPYPGIRRRGAAAEEESGGSNKLYLALGAVVLLAAMGVGGWFVFQGTGGGTANVPKLGDDAKVEKMIKDETATELKEWINANQARMLSGWTRGKTLANADKLYGMGAKKLLAFGGGVMCMSIAIELPPEPEKRAELFKWYDREKDPSDPRTKDVGQKYLLYFTGL